MTQSKPGSDDAGQPSEYKPEAVSVKLVRRLRERGLPLEMRVARTLRAHDFAVTPSLYVNVPGATRPREIDARAVLTRSTLPGIRISFELYVECKWSGDKPWVVYSSQEAVPPRPIAVQSVLANPMGEALLWLIADDPQLLNHLPYLSTGTSAHGGLQVNLGTKGGGDRADIFYRTMQSVTAIARSGVGARDSSMTLVDNTRDAVFAFAVVVVDGPLFAASLENDSEDLRVTPIDRARVFWRGLRAGGVTAVDLVRADALDAYAADCVAGLGAPHSDYLLLAHSEVIQDLDKGVPEALRFRLHGRPLNVPSINFPTVIRGLVSKLAAEQTARRLGG